MNDRDPQRLEDGEIGAALAAEREAGFAAARVEAAKAAVRARIASGAPPRRPWLRIAGGTGAAVLAAALAARLLVASDAPRGETSAARAPSLSSGAPESRDGADSVATPAAVARRDPGSAVRPDAAAHALPPMRAPTPQGDLPEQIARYETARDAADAGRLDEAIGDLDALLARWPASPLRAEVELSKGEVLARAHRDREAVDLLARLLDDPAQAAKRVEIALLLGDEEVRIGDCSAARRILAIPAESGTVEQVSAASGALARCATIP